MMNKYYTEPLEIKGRERSAVLTNRLILAPMAGVSDLPFRLLCHEQGAGLVCMEMISAKAVCYRNRATVSLMRTLPEERPVSLQLFGHEPEIMAEALDRMEEGRTAEDGFLPSFDLLDINMGCPVPKIVNNGEGSALMKSPELIEKLVRAAAAHGSRPVTVKLRTGIDEAHINVVECALAAQEGGAAAVGVHGRTRTQMYSGRADWTKIAEVREALRIPVFGNGDVTDGPSALRLFKETGCDAVMIGRGAQGNPWIFGDIQEYLLRGGDDSARSAGRHSPHGGAERKAMILRHAELQLRFKSPAVAMQEMRKHVAWYIAGFPGSSRIREEVNRVESFEELRALLDRCF
ncbi:tRNA dihydrouridine synthase DusB [Lachnoclostridium sp. Marseille-P6806]|uniref:tRNA dihydrouridine synthase DusB n=1 Tax=Lachnoclostridium sp. Marseille-P6806 TaxID=2364793 RepID=UPI001F5F013A|nr:tRNA dihydrouridine synthase DusB [Lachnoclostridium sp. Marseille-P6806]